MLGEAMVGPTHDSADRSPVDAMKFAFGSHCVVDVVPSETADFLMRAGISHSTIESLATVDSPSKPETAASVR